MATHLLELGFQYSSSLLHPSEQTTRDERNNNLHGLDPMQTPDHVVDEDESWEVRAFAEDTANVMGTTWPPRSYTCTYCRREFRSAQALGGHMNVHRRDRARLHQAVPNAIKPATPDFNGGGSLCVLYQFPNPNNVFHQNANYIHHHSPNSSLFSIPHYSLNNNLMPSTASSSFPAFPTTNHPAGASTFSRPSFREERPFSTSSMENGNNNNQELDLELRLGHGPSTQKISNLEAACLKKRSSN